jgi:predicted ATPase with chaperone activity
VRGALIASGLALPAHRITINLADIKGQESAKRALEIAAAGGHNLLMVGPPSAGKSMLARLPSILPQRLRSCWKCRWSPRSPARAAP